MNHALSGKRFQGSSRVLCGNGLPSEMATLKPPTASEPWPHRREGAAPTQFTRGLEVRWELRPRSDAALDRKPIAPRAAIPQDHISLGNDCGSCALAAKGPLNKHSAQLEAASCRGRHSHKIASASAVTVGAAPSRRRGPWTSTVLSVKPHRAEGGTPTRADKAEW